MGFPVSAIPGLFKKSKPQEKKFDVSDSEHIKKAEREFKDPGRKTSAEWAIEAWKNADPEVKDLIILGLEVSIRDIAKERPDGKIAKKLDTLVAARDLLWTHK